jgi:hypothetical protein
MNDFPQLKTGAVLQYPTGKRLECSTRVTRFLDGSEQRFRDFAAPIQFWAIRLDLLTEPEMRQLQDFYESKHGQYGSFAFVDPWDGTEYPNCSFASDLLTLEYQEESRGQMSLVIRNNEV